VAKFLFFKKIQKNPKNPKIFKKKSKKIKKIQEQTHGTPFNAVTIPLMDRTKLR